MASKRSKRRAQKTRRTIPAGLLAVAGMVVVAAIAVTLVWVSPRVERVELPELDLDAMEPQVSARIGERMEAVKASPRSADTWGQLGLSLQAHGLDVEAAQCYREALSRDENEFRWSYLLVHALRSFDAEAALAQSEQALALDPSYPPLHLIRAELLEERNELGAARAHYETALGLDPDSALAAFGAGRLFAAEGDLDSALVLLTRAVELDENAGAIHGALAQVYRRQGDRERATASARFAAEHTDTVRIVDPIHFEMRRASVSSLALLDEAVRSSESGSYDRAVTILRQLVELRPEDADMRARLGDALKSAGKPSEAFERYNDAVGINPRHTWALRGLGDVSNMEGEVERAESYYREVLALDADDVATLLNLGSLLAFKGGLDEGERLFRRGLEIDPEHFGCHRQLGELLLRADRLGEAVEHFEAALVGRPEFGPVHASLAVAFGRQGRFDEAWPHVELAEKFGAALPPQVLSAMRQASRGGN